MVPSEECDLLSGEPYVKGPGQASDVSASGRSEIDPGIYNDPFHTLCEVISALLEDNIATLGLEVAILLKGPVGPVMSSVAEGVAAHLGFHFMQVSHSLFLGELRRSLILSR